MNRFRARTIGLASGLICSMALAAATQARDFDDPASNDTAQQFVAGNVQRQDTPDDPDYDRAEPDDEDGVSSTNLFEECRVPLC